MINNKKITAIILAAGNSTRYGKNKNKNFELINNKPVLLYSIQIFDKNKYIDDIIIACKENEKEEIKTILEKESFTKNINIIIGGKTRKESVYNCINAINSNIVIIHDGARPLIKDEYINNSLKYINKYKGTTIGVLTKDTIKLTDENNNVINTTNRSNTWLIQTPQCFDRLSLLNAHNKYQTEKVTDDCSLLEKEGFKIKVIPGDYSNIKITTSDDLDIATLYIKKEN